MSFQPSVLPVTTPPPPWCHVTPVPGVHSRPVLELLGVISVLKAPQLSYLDPLGLKTAEVPETMKYNIK